MPIDNQPVDHHFVPIFYLNAWTTDNRVTRYYRPYKDVDASPIGPKHTGFEPHLYTLQGVPPDQQAFLETSFFKPVDTAGAIAHQILLAGGLRRLTDQQRVDWARFMMSMQLRSPFSLGELTRLTEHVMRSNPGSAPEIAEAMKAGSHETMYDWMKETDPVLVAEAHKRFLPGLIDHETMGHYLVNMFWGTLDVSMATQSVLTCDRPLYRTSGWKHPDAVLIFPLSPSVLFIATNSESRMAAVVNTPRSHHVKMVNKAMVTQAANAVYGIDASQLAFVEKYLRRPDQEPIPGPIGKGQPDCPP